MRSTRVILIVAAFAPLVTAPNLSAQDAASRDGLAFFESRVRPVLVKYCHECHSAESGKAKGGLRVDSRAALLAGGDTGPALVPGQPDRSLLIKAVSHVAEELKMPPKQKLPDTVIADLWKWIALGAPDPRTGPAPVTVHTSINVEKGRAFWAFQPVANPAPPAVRDASWPRTDVDRFILAALERNHLTPAADADPATLIRRASFVLTGLPPTPEEVEAFVKECGIRNSEFGITGVASGHSAFRIPRSAWENLIDRLLASPRFGERWGRHWLDVARFAESTGGDHNNIYPHAWRYRDYVIDAFNADKPYDRFILEQLAGDLLPIANDREWATNLVATGFLAIGVKQVGSEDARQFHADLVDEQIDTTTRAFLGLTVACARCHDHKFDPVPQTDYYALAGIFRNTATFYGLLQAQARQNSLLLDVTGLGLAPDRKPLTPTELTALQKERDAARKKMDDIMSEIRSGDGVTRNILRRARTVRDQTEMALQSYDARGNPKVFVMGVQDRDLPLETRLLVRGELDKPGQTVPRGFVQVVAKPGAHALPPTTRGSGRLEFARWIASPDNPLTARVMVNRVWHHLFGQGLVRTTDDFGSTGETPSHPELLDHLAARFVANGWSVKQLIRDILLSRAWQMSSTHHAAHFAVDPDNRLLWRANPRRLEAEAIRDAMLAVSGQLDTKRPTGTLLAGVGEGTVGLSVYEPEIRKLDGNMRSVFLPRVRAVLPESLELFDAPDASLVTGARETTTVPLQSLYLMNAEFVRRQAEGFARRVRQERSTEAQLIRAHMLAFGRPPTDAEKQFASQFATALRSAPGKPADYWTAYCHALLCTAEFAQLD